MKNNVAVTFESEGKKIKVPFGTTLLQAAEKAGVGIRSDCGGKALSELTNEEKAQLSPSEIARGFRLACKSKVTSDVTVIIPLETRVKTHRFQVGGLERTVSLNPALNKFHVSLSKPNLRDFRPDLERLLENLAKLTSKAEELEIELEVLRSLPSFLRKAQWDMTATVWNNRKILSLEPKDTSGKLFGFTVDVGTSKIVGHLVDLTTGETVGVEATENPQTAYGEDLISRVTTRF